MMKILNILISQQYGFYFSAEQEVAKSFFKLVVILFTLSFPQTWMGLEKESVFVASICGITKNPLLKSVECGAL
jgi:hypothetical protein